jgi:hypothetical protein
MKKMFLIFSHKLTNLQKEDASVSLGIKQFSNLPDDLQKKWSGISSKGELPVKELLKIIDWLIASSNKGDYVLVQGDFGATYYIVDYCLKNSLVPVYSTSERIYEFIYNQDDSVKNQHIFKHVCFRIYKPYI